MAKQTGTSYPQTGYTAPPTQEAWMDEVRALRSAGKLIPAIKLYRERTGVGLKEAKDAVEDLPG